MNNSKTIQDSIAPIINIIGQALEIVGFDLLPSNELEEQLARLSFQVAPSYLPLITDDSGVLAIHVWPARSVSTSPIVHLPHDEQEARFVCDSLSSLPSAIWLWVSSRYRDEPDKLRNATDALAAGIPVSKPVKQELWSFLNEQASRWTYEHAGINEAWTVADVGHPFAGMPSLTPMMNAGAALPMIEQFVKERKDNVEAEFLSAYLATLAKAKRARDREDILRVLSGEAWRNLGCMVAGRWRESGRGICEWDCTLKHTEDPEATFRGTPFEPLIGHPDTYSGEDKEGPKRLLAVADNFHKANDPAGELRQCRNAATLAILTAGEYPLDYAERIATVCDAIEKDSLAAAIARESARVHSQGP